EALVVHAFDHNLLFGEVLATDGAQVPSLAASCQKKRPSPAGTTRAPFTNRSTSPPEPAVSSTICCDGGKGSSIFGRLQRLASAQENFPAGTELEYFAPAAVRLARIATAAPVPDQPVTPVCPMLARHELH